MKKANIIKFPGKEQDYKQTVSLMRIADQLDDVIIEHLEAEKLSVHEVAGILAHRLGNLIRVAEKKEELIELCESMIRKQSSV